MTLALRIIKKKNWYNSSAYDWLDESEFLADALQDLKTEDNNLSIWLIEEGDDTTLRRVIAGLTARRDHIVNFDYCVIDFTVIDALKIRYKRSDGDGNDHLANKKWHFDLIQLSGNKIWGLAEYIRKNPDARHRINDKSVLKILIDAVNAGNINQDDLGESIVKKIQSEIK